MVVVLAPVFHDVPRFIQRLEPVLAQTFMPELAIERFDKCILSGFARFDKVELHAFVQ